jgi:prevent-host-death family protein
MTDIGLSERSARLVLCHDRGMRIMALSHVRDHLSAIVHEVESTHERVTITRHGRPVVVLIAVDDLAMLAETIDILSTPGAPARSRQRNGRPAQNTR